MKEAHVAARKRRSCLRIRHVLTKIYTQNERIFRLERGVFECLILGHGVNSRGRFD